MKPSFTIHPDSIGFTLALGLLCCLATSLVQAEVIHRTVSSNSYRFVQMDGESTNDVYNRMAAACNAVQKPSGYATDSTNCSLSSSKALDDGTADSWKSWAFKKYEYNEATGQNDVIYEWYRNAWYGYTNGNCPNGAPDEDGDGVCDVVPENCEELAAAEDPTGTIYESDKFFNYACNKGCLIEMDTATHSKTTNTWLVNAKYTGDNCPNGTGYDPDQPLIAGFKDVYPEDTDFQNCYNADGTFLGRISTNLECPTYVNCWNEDRTHVDAVAPDPGSCPTGTMSDSQRDWQDATTGQTETTTTNPDGSTETTTETTQEQTAHDGTTSTRTTSTTQTCDPAGNCTETTTEKDAAATCEGPDCPEKPSLEELEDCNTELICKGDVFQCAQIQMQREQACRLSEKSVQDWVNSDDFQDDIAVGTDEDGQLSVLNGGTINVGTTLGVDGFIGDNGETAACPAPYDNGLFELDITPLCLFMDRIRIGVIFFNAIGILWFLRRSLLETD